MPLHPADAAVHRHTLPNGLTVLVEPIRHAPVVALQAWVRAGGADESEEVLGVAHLHEHMLFKGTRRRGVGAIAREVESAGGEVNAWTSLDETVYHLTMGRDEARLGVDILADALRNSAFDPAELARESEVVLEEIRRANDTPARRMYYEIFRVAFAPHPYARPVLGTESIVRAMSRAQIVGFYRQFYRPDNITFVAAGDFEPAAMLATIEELLGDWATPEAPVVRPDRAALAPLSAPQVRVLAEDVAEARMSVAWRGPALGDPQVAAFDALAMVLGHGESSRLFEVLRRQDSLVHDVHAFAYTPREHGLLVVGAGLVGPALTEVLARVLSEVQALAAAPVDAGELTQVQTVLLSEAAFQRESMQGQARKRGFFQVTGGDWRMEEAYLERVRQLTGSDLQAAAREILRLPPVLVLQVPHAEAVRYPSAAALEAQLAAPAARPAARPPVPAPPRAVAPQSAGGAGEVRRFDLACGATLLVRPEAGPVVALRAAALGGQRWESPAQAGIGHLFGQVFGQATKARSSRQMAQELAGLGGGLGGFAGRNSVGLSGSFLAERAASGLDLFAEALAAPVFSEADVAREKAQIAEAIRARADHPSAVAMDEFVAALYGGHPYGLPIMGTSESIAALDGAALGAYARRFLAPGRLVLAVVGDCRPEWVAERLDRALEGEPPAPLPPPTWASRPQTREVHRHLARQQSQVVVGSLGVGIGQPDRLVAEVLTTILSGQGGRLFTDLRDRQSLAYSVYSGSVPGIDAGHLLVFIATHPDKVRQAIDGIRYHLREIARQEPSAQEMARARRYLIGSQAIGLQTSAARAMTMALDEAYGLGHDAYLNYPAQIAQVTAAQVLGLAQRLLAPDDLVQVVVGPTPPAAAG